LPDLPQIVVPALLYKALVSGLVAAATFHGLSVVQRLRGARRR
jgi:hypothetical protein